MAILNGYSFVEISASASEYVNVTFFFSRQKKNSLENITIFTAEKQMVQVKDVFSLQKRRIFRNGNCFTLMFSFFY